MPWGVHNCNTRVCIDGVECARWGWFVRAHSANKLNRSYHTFSMTKPSHFSDLKKEKKMAEHVINYWDYIGFCKNAKFPGRVCVFVPWISVDSSSGIMAILNISERTELRFAGWIICSAFGNVWYWRSYAECETDSVRFLKWITIRFGWILFQWNRWNGVEKKKTWKIDRDSHWSILLNAAIHFPS